LSRYHHNKRACWNKSWSKD